MRGNYMIQCFKIKQRQLWLEHILVEHNGLPIFYICTDSEVQRYVVLLADQDTSTYIITEVSTEDIIALLEQRLTMKELVLSNSHCWEVLANDDTEDFNKDVIKRISTKKIPKKWLPIEDSYLGTLCPSDVEYLKALST